jgi:hypothetical protein
VRTSKSEHEEMACTPRSTRSIRKWVITSSLVLAFALPYPLYPIWKDFIVFSSSLVPLRKKGLDAINRLSCSDRSNRRSRPTTSVSVSSAYCPRPEFWFSTGRIWIELHSLSDTMPTLERRISITLDSYFPNSEDLERPRFIYVSIPGQR